jgi:hypothetical protein
MPLKKLIFKPGVNRENTRYTTEGGFYDCDKIRFRQGTPEKIGGWQRISEKTFLGVCRSIWNWVTVGGSNLLGVGTHLKFYIGRGGDYYDITPLRASATLTDPFTAANGSSVLTVTDSSHGGKTGDYVTFSGAVGLGGNVTAPVLNREYVITVVDADTYTINMSVTANATDAAGSPGGGAAVIAAYQVSVGSAINQPVSGWGAGPWGLDTWSSSSSSLSDGLRVWSQANYGEDLIFGPNRGGLYYWSPVTSGVGTRAVNLNTLPGASDVPVVQTGIAVSDASRFVLAFGCNDYGLTTLDPMLIRWSDQEDAANWTPAATNQAGSIRLSTGSEIISHLQTRQEILVFTDAALYSLQYLGPPYVWGSSLLADNISIVGKNTVAMGSGVVFWMGIDKFYRYDGRVQTLRCDLREYIFSDINPQQYAQFFAGTNEGFNEVWWFYCSENSTTIDKYVVYNYAEDIWYYGTMARTAWLDTSLQAYPLAATYSNNLVSHEFGVDNNETATTLPIEAYIETSQFDIDDGHNFGFIWRILPDLTFRGSTAGSPQVTMYLYPYQNSGSGVNNPASVGGISNAPVTRVATIPVEQFTGQINTRVRGRQLSMKIESTQLGTTWQLGAPRIDIKQDGRR